MMINNEVEVQVKRLSDRAWVPMGGRPGDAGYDLVSTEKHSLNPGQRKLIGTGIAMAIPLGYVGLIWPRSGLAVRHGIDVLAGVIDAGYRDEVRVLLLNTGSKPVVLDVEERIAQLVVQPVMALDCRVVGELPESVRGEDGFGSSGRF